MAVCAYQVPDVFRAHGLLVHVERCGEQTPSSGTLTADVCWRIFRKTDPLPRSGADAARPGMQVSIVPYEGGSWTRHALLDQNGPACSFLVSPDGTVVHTCAYPCTTDAHLLDLFVEPVMRTVMWRRGLPSFHAAALEKCGQAILLLGAKGAGKSSLACALLSQDWNLLADDLVRVVEVHGVWHAVPGTAQIKLNADAVSALGLDSDNLRPRWGWSQGKFEKLLLSPTSSRITAGGMPIVAAFILTPRQPGGAAVVRLTAEPAPSMAIELLAHLTADPGGSSMPRGPMLRAVSGLMHQAAIRKATLPDAFSGLARAASELDLVALGSRAA